MCRWRLADQVEGEGWYAYFFWSAPSFDGLSDRRWEGALPATPWSSPWARSDFGLSTFCLDQLAFDVSGANPCGGRTRGAHGFRSDIWESRQAPSTKTRV